MARRHLGPFSGPFTGLSCDRSRPAGTSVGSGATSVDSVQRILELEAYAEFLRQKLYIEKDADLNKRETVDALMVIWQALEEEDAEHSQ